MKVWILYQDQDNSCADEDCCGGPSPWHTAKIFSSKEAAKAAGLDRHDLGRLNEIEVDKNEYQSIDL